MPRPIVLEREVSCPYGEICVVGMVDPFTGFRSVAVAGVSAGDGDVGRYGRRIGRFARKVAKSKALKKLATTTLRVAKAYTGMQRPQGAALGSLAQTAMRAARAQERDAERAGTRLQRTIARERRARPDDPELQAEAELVEDIEDDLFDDGFGDW